LRGFLTFSTTLWQSIQDNGVLEAVRQWLEPIAPSGALPAVGIQKAIFEILPKVSGA
jgi:transcription factor SPN1